MTGTGFGRGIRVGRGRGQAGSCAKARRRGRFLRTEGGLDRAWYARGLGSRSAQATTAASCTAITHPPAGTFEPAKRARPRPGSRTCRWSTWALPLLFVNSL